MTKIVKPENRTTAIGTLARDPEFAYSASGTPRFSATVAGESQVAENGKVLSIPFYHRITVLGKYAEVLNAAQMKAGQAVLVEGVISDSTYTTDKGTSQVQSILADRVDALQGAVPTISDEKGGVRMVGGLNEANICGNVSQPGELHYTASGKAVLEFSVAVNESWVDSQGVRQKKATFVKCSVWNEHAEQLAGQLTKGQPVNIRGRLAGETPWVDGKGVRHVNFKLEASVVLCLQGRVNQSAVTSATNRARREQFGPQAQAAAPRRAAPAGAQRAQAQPAAPAAPRAVNAPNFAPARA
ncbi:MAG: single-stranded DNA-binding protein [Deinococcus sp.]|nr:single-stranded DNA-binding protein [Deinococcus sp.]